MKLQLTVCATEQWIYSTVICCMFRVQEVAGLSTTVPLKTQTYWTIGMMQKDTTVSSVKFVDLNNFLLFLITAICLVFNSYSNW